MAETLGFQSEKTQPIVRGAFWLNGNVETVLRKHGDARESILEEMCDLLADSKAPRQRPEVSIP